MKKALELQDWGLTEDQLISLNYQATILIRLPYPDYQSVVAYAPEERRKIIARKLREAFKELKIILKEVPFEIEVGSSIKPRIIRTKLALNQIPALTEKSFVDSISFEAIEGLHIIKNEVKGEESIWSIKARFAIQVGNVVGGMQQFEDRILLIKAINEEQAKEKLLQTFDLYAKPYLNSSGRLIRWKFEEFLNAYDTGIFSVNDFLKDEGVEVFSEIRKRKLRPTHEWRVLYLFILFLVQCLFSVSTVQAQSDTVERYKKNAVYLEIGGNAYLYSLNFDHKFAKHASWRIGAMGISLLGSSPHSTFRDTYVFFPIMINYLAGSRNSRFELGGGIITGSFENSFFIAGTATIGYRYQPLKGGFNFRIGFTPIILPYFFLPHGGISIGYGF